MAANPRETGCQIRNHASAWHRCLNLPASPRRSSRPRVGSRPMPPARALRQTWHWRRPYVFLFVQKAKIKKCRSDEAGRGNRPVVLERGGEMADRLGVGHGHGAQHVSQVFQDHAQWRFFVAGGNARVDIAENEIACCDDVGNDQLTASVGRIGNSLLTVEILRRRFRGCRLQFWIVLYRYPYPYVDNNSPMAAVVKASWRLTDRADGKTRSRQASRKPRHSAPTVEFCRPASLRRVLPSP